MIKEGTHTSAKWIMLTIEEAGLQMLRLGRHGLLMPEQKKKTLFRIKKKKLEKDDEQRPTLITCKYAFK